MKTLFAAAVVFLLAAAPALADCAATHVVDRCLIGTWTYASGGSASWMRNNIHMAHVTAIAHNNVTIALRADGTFATSNTDVHATVAANNGDATGSARATGAASGNWSAADGHLNFCATASSFRQTLTVVIHGRPITVTPPPQVPRPVTMAYTCAATELTTTQSMPHLEPIVTVYRRSH